jgi:hypothetical protein
MAFAPISGKVKAATVAASVTTVITGILAPHVFWQSVPSDVRGLVEAGVTGAITFGFGWLAKHGIDGAQVVEDAEAVAADFGVPFMQLADAPAESPVAEPVAAPVGEAKPLA